ncbi:hypothetical protein NUU61_004846 [Penicillium alfredii]|uniref:Uncharacterized protein n=1 Tax=Penicillium alfredii TaxID=1506179 RepID=A0A9W9K7C1_9EURO|nr:uncharacterized protein NUU61_004846 [Penicillium alfredii]KAJ5095490.1 hypothetical protein NUU61_004846 [Penicillium alfredii]
MDQETPTADPPRGSHDVLVVLTLLLLNFKTSRLFKINPKPFRAVRDTRRIDGAEAKDADHPANPRVDAC